MTFRSTYCPEQHRLRGGLRNAGLTVVLAIVLATMLAYSNAANAAMEGDRAPDWSLVSISGKNVAFPQAAGGKPSIILFWATWCPYCKALMPYLEEIRKQYESQQVQVFAINIKEDGDPVAFAADNEYDFVYLLNGDAIAERYTARYTPGLFVVDADGRIVYRRKSTELPPGRKVAEFWAERVTAELDGLLSDSE